MLPGYLLETMKTIVKKANPAFKRLQVLPLLSSVQRAASGAAAPIIAPVTPPQTFPPGARINGSISGPPDTRPGAIQLTN